MNYSLVGLARSGVAAANALISRGHNVLISDLRDAEQLADFLKRLSPQVEVALEQNRVRAGDIVVVSPGIKPNAPIFEEARQKGCEVIGEVALFQRLKGDQPVLAVTGTDGKSTTTTWLAAMCEASGRPTWVGGNLGTPLCESVAELTAEHVVVAEVSCFQLSTAAEFHPQVAVITNLAPDHLDYYGGSYDAYTAAKARVMAHLGAGEAAVLNADDALLCTWSAPAGAPTLWFSRERSLTKNEQGVFVDGLSIRARLGGLDTLLVPLAELSLPGAHNVENAMAAAAAALSFGISREAVCHAMRTFGGLTHRIERVRELNGITWYNDSKATNPHAAEAAIRAFDEPLVLICGGSEKGSEFADWADLVIENCRHVICFGESSPRMVDALGGRVSVSRVSDLTSAVAEAQRAGADGGIVILSPACASFDQFDSYEHRGDVFKEMINAL